MSQAGAPKPPPTDSLNIPTTPSGRLTLWWLAARPKTLPAAMAPVLVGTAVAWQHGVFHTGAFLAALSGAILIQIGTNLGNDYFDFLKGADTRTRLGPIRVTQAGLIPPRQVLVGTWVSFGLASLAGVYLTLLAGWPVIVIGAASILSGIAYTAGPFPLGYYGLGDLAVFLFFGPVAVGGTYFVQAGRLDSLALWAAIPIGLLATSILVVNNLRDIQTDKAAGKRTLAVHLGAQGTRIEFGVLLAGAYLVPLWLWLIEGVPAWIMLPWLTLGWSAVLIRKVARQTGRALNLALAEAGRLELIYGLLLSLGVVLG